MAAADDQHLHQWTRLAGQSMMFKAPATLAAVYPSLLKHAVQQFDSADVMRFLGRRVGERVHGHFEGEVVTTLKTRDEGTRIKHALNRN